MSTTPFLSQFSLAGKTAVVTGGTGVLGGAMARGLAAAGARVAILGRREDKAAEVADAIRREGGEAMPLPADVLDRERLTQARDDLLARWETVDILVNAAGGNVPDATVVGDLTFFDLTPEAFRRVVDLNLLGSLLPSQIFGQIMAEKGQGSIVNISSMAAQRPLTRVIGYAAAKAAIDNFTRWLAVELATKYGEGVRVNAIAPGEVETSILSPGTEKIVESLPLRRLGQPSEVADVIWFLCSDQSSYVTGAEIEVNAGQHV